MFEFTSLLMMRQDLLQEEMPQLRHLEELGSAGAHRPMELTVGAPASPQRFLQPLPRHWHPPQSCGELLGRPGGKDSQQIPLLLISTLSPQLMWAMAARSSPTRQGWILGSLLPLVPICGTDLLPRELKGCRQKLVPKTGTFSSSLLSPCGHT